MKQIYLSQTSATLIFVLLSPRVVTSVSPFFFRNMACLAVDSLVFSLANVFGFGSLILNSLSSVLLQDSLRVGFDGLCLVVVSLNFEPPPRSLSLAFTLSFGISSSLELHSKQPLLTRLELT